MTCGDWFKHGKLYQPADDCARQVGATRVSFYLDEARRRLDDPSYSPKEFCDVVFRARLWASSEQDRDRAILLVDMARKRYGAGMARFCNKHNF